MLYRRFERMIDIFQPVPSSPPPNRLLPFYLYYLRQVWPSFAALLMVGLIGALIEVALFDYLSCIIDMVNTTPAAGFFSAHAPDSDLDGGRSHCYCDRCLLVCTIC